MDIPVLAIEACQYKDLPSHSKVISKNQLEYYTWIHLPPEFGRDFTLFDLSETQPTVVEIPDFYKFVYRQAKRPWIRIFTKILNTRVGYHQYRLNFIHDHTSDIVSIYINYTIQDDNPAKPYIYMNRKEGEISESNICQQALQVQ